mmetsp:Transcript_15714/g.30160  ORF Transcript_15714/g.30160 Transcript_15714/m.30160 type:complete len:579 (+) Transcript_15714:176-1912(+)|eukprot:CAMPEP_0114263318 /NCGR_PEP_ID=MMETSP0058-20121206/22423_1 /TAXON_ID=36894 /ORGANISM="Pyramimonas parkeae, CCMP726" /LENGTH=578 /DNA_ID=CAMNT_0001379545 /DNA_START=88 /DNA_END=1824 /DNA_ORIENTATION=+
MAGKYDPEAGREQLELPEIPNPYSASKSEPGPGYDAESTLELLNNHETATSGTSVKTRKQRMPDSELQKATTRAVLAAAAALSCIALALALWLGRRSFPSYGDGGTPSQTEDPLVYLPDIHIGYIQSNVTPTVRVYSVKSNISLADMDLASVQNDLPGFKNNFVSTMSSAAQVPKSSVEITSVQAGSVVVASKVHFPIEDIARAAAFQSLVREDAERIFRPPSASDAFPEYGNISAAGVELSIGEAVTCAHFNLGYVGDGWCDSGTANTAACSWDGGDCCNPDVPLFDCKDPLSENFGRSAPKGWVSPVPVNPRFTIGEREISSPALVKGYNNFYEFGTSKTGVQNRVRDHTDFFEGPWEIVIDGLIENPMTLDVKELIAMFHLEERLYRHRCVEAWSITVPWVGFPLYKLLDVVKPLPSATYVEFQTFKNTAVSREQTTQPYYPWPYLEGVSIEEAKNEMAFLSVGQYQEPLPGQSGAPIRLTLPWKYGFKSAKSLVRISFVDVQPVNFWKTVNQQEYGFWANVNPEVNHPRWSQADERELVDNTYSNTRIPTLLYNGYAEQVRHLYENMDGEPLYM